MECIEEAQKDEFDANEYLYSKTQNVLMEKGEGIYLIDSSGKRYIDCASATFNLSLGYQNKQVIEHVKSQMDNLIHVTSSYMTPPISELAKKLAKLTPKGLDKIHLKVSSGSVANEGAIKMAQHLSGKKDIISCYRSHIGQTIFTSALSGNSFRRKPFPGNTHGILHTPAPYCHRCPYSEKPETCSLLCAEVINDQIEHASSGNVAAFIIEPIFGNGDNIVPPKKYMQAIRQICDSNDISLIFDEIQTGIGRTGHMFAADYYEVSPDIMTMAKGLGGTGFQVAAIACKEKYTSMDAMHHSFTYGSNLLAAAAGVKTLEIVDNKEFLDNVKMTGDFIMKSLERISEKHRFISDVRGVGLMIGFEISKADGSPDVELTNKLADMFFSNGMILRTSRYGRGNVLKIRPPLTLTIDEAIMIVDTIEMTLDQNFR